MMLFTYGTLLGTLVLMLAHGSSDIQTAAMWLLIYYHLAIVVFWMWKQLNSFSKTPDLDRKVARMEQVRAIQQKHRRRRAFTALLGYFGKDDSK